MSVFLAVDPDQPTRARLRELLAELSSQASAKWVRAERLHITLVFLGNPNHHQVARLLPAVDELAKQHRPFSLSIQGVGTFATRRAPSVLWLGVTGELDALQRVHEASEAALLTEPISGLNPDEKNRAYRPHLTLARSKSGSSFDALEKSLSSFHSSPFVVDRLTLYESKNDTYVPLHQARLAPRTTS